MLVVFLGDVYILFECCFFMLLVAFLVFSSCVSELFGGVVVFRSFIVPVEDAE